MGDTFCVMPHRRVRNAGEVIGMHTEFQFDADGECVTNDAGEPIMLEVTDFSEGGEVVYDHEKPRAGSHPGSLLCKGHLNRLRELIAETPTTIGWIREQLEPASIGGEGKAPKRMGSKMPISAAAVDDADDILGMLFTWAFNAAEELRQTPPRAAGTWRIIKSRWTGDGDMRVQGLRSDDGTAIGRVTRWLLGNLDAVACLPWIGEMAAEIGDQRRRILGRYPLQDRPRPVGNVECPDCGNYSLVLYMPSMDPKWIVEPYLDRSGKPVGLVWQGNPFGDGAHCRLDERRRPIVATVRRLAYAAPLLVQCSDPHCGEIVPEPSWRRIVATLEAQRKAEKRRKTA